jgi:flagellar protein FliL
MSAPKKEESTEAKPAGGGGGGGGGLGMVALLLGVLNLGGTGFVAFKVIKMPHAAPAGAHEGGGEGKEGGEAKKPVVELPSVPLDPFVVNLNEPGSNRYLKATVEVEVTDAPAAEELKKAKRAVRDDLLRYLSSLTVNDTLGEEAKGKMELAMLARIDKQIGSNKKVSRVFFNDLMIQ